MSYYIIRNVGFYPLLQNPFWEGKLEVAAAPGATKPILYFTALKGHALASSSHRAVFFPSCLFIYLFQWVGREKGLFLPCWWLELANGESDKCFRECAVENEEGDWDLPVCQQWARVESCPEWLAYISSKELGFAGFIILPPAGSRILLKIHLET